jgi:hypothetical protein
MHSRRILAAIVFALSSAACDEKLSSVAGPTPDLEPTFSSIQRDIFEQTDLAGRTACVTCHTNVGHAPFANLNLTHDVAYDQLVGVPSSEKPGLLRVAPGNADASYIVHKVEGLPGIVGVRMPRGSGPYLTDGQILILRRWIDNGAPRN